MSKGDAQMFLYLNEYGYKASKNKDFLVVEHPNRENEEYPLNSLHAVYFAGEGRISKAIVLELTRRNIDVLLLSDRGKPMIYLFPTHTKPKIWDLWKRQILLDPRKNALLARRFVLNAIKAKAWLLTELMRNRKRTNKEITMKIVRYRNRIRGIERKVKAISITNFKKLRKVLMGWEGFSAKLYFEALSYVIPPKFGYVGIRTRRPPKDAFNAAISFGYSYLKYIVERDLIFFGVNPYYGILHQETDKVYPFLTFDVMEGFRHSFVDRTAISLISRRKLNPEKHFRKFNGSVHLNKFGQSILYKSLFEGKIKNSRLISKEIKFLLGVMK